MSEIVKNIFTFNLIWICKEADIGLRYTVLLGSFSNIGLLLISEVNSCTNSKKLVKSVNQHTSVTVKGRPASAF